jgi:hypothetical protein
MLSNEQNPAQGRAAPVATSKRFRDMNFKQKAAYCCKAFICVLTFGFAYPNIFVD